MSDYIKRENAIKKIKEQINNLAIVGRLTRIIISVPPADVAEVKHGKWIKDEGGFVICSNCGEEHCWGEYKAPYCNQCGAKMDLEE